MIDILHPFQTMEPLLKYVGEGSYQGTIETEEYLMAESFYRPLVRLLLEYSSAQVQIVVSWAVNIHCSRDWT